MLLITAVRCDESSLGLRINQVCKSDGKITAGASWNTKTIRHEFMYVQAMSLGGRQWKVPDVMDLAWKDLGMFSALSKQ